MKTVEKKIFFKILFLLIFVLLAGSACCAIVFLAPFNFNANYTSSFVDSEMVYFMLALCALIVISLTAMLFVCFGATKNTRKALKNLGKVKIKKAKKAKVEGRFSMLSKIDKKMSSYKAPQAKKITLEEICIAFRSYAANELKLYYSIEDIRRFIAGMSVTRLILLQGMSGTGKTSLAYAMGQFIDNESVIVPIQPMWKERSDMIGYFNEFTKKFNETTLLRKMYEAGYRKEMYVTVLDEVNISRIEYYFAEFLSLLELPDASKRYLDVVSDVWEKDPVRLKDGKINLPENMWFIGTANNDDSTFSISDKVYDRAMVISLESKCVPFEAEKQSCIRLPYSQWIRLFDEAKKLYPISSDIQEKIRKIDNFLIEEYRISFGNRIMKQIREYVPVMVACGGSEAGAIDDILANKVLRKLEQQNPLHVRNSLDALIELIKEQFGESLPLCTAFLHRFKVNIEI